MKRRLDHVVIATADLDGTADRYRDLGFTVTPRSDHPFGTSNRLVVLPNAYIELVAVTRPEALPSRGFAAEVRDAIEARRPISHVVVRSEHPEADRLALADRVVDVVEFSRPAGLPGGGEVEASFVCLMTGPGDPIGAFLCHHLTPASVWSPDALAHANGASDLCRVRVDLGPGTALLLDELGLEPPIEAGRPTLWMMSPTTALNASVEGVDVRLVSHVGESEMTD